MKEMKELIHEELERAFVIGDKIEEMLYSIEDGIIRQAIVINLIDGLAADCGMTSKEWMEEVIPMTVMADLMFGRTESRKGDR